MSSHTRGNVHEHYLQKDIFKAVLCHLSCRREMSWFWERLVCLIPKKWRHFRLWKRFVVCNIFKTSVSFFNANINIFLLDEKCYECGNPLPI